LALFGNFFVLFLYTTQFRTAISHHACSSKLYSITYLLTYLLAHLPTYLLTHLPTHILTYLLTHLFNYSLTYLQ